MPSKKRTWAPHGSCADRRKSHTVNTRNEQLTGCTNSNQSVNVKYDIECSTIAEKNSSSLTSNNKDKSASLDLVENLCNEEVIRGVDCQYKDKLSSKEMVTIIDDATSEINNIAKDENINMKRKKKAFKSMVASGSHETNCYAKGQSKCTVTNYDVSNAVTSCAQANFTKVGSLQNHQSLQEIKEIRCTIRVDNNLIVYQCRLHPFLVRKLRLCVGEVVCARSEIATVYLEVSLSSSANTASNDAKTLKSKEVMYVHNDIAEMLLSSEVVITKAPAICAFQQMCNRNNCEQCCAIATCEKETLPAPLLSSITLIIEPPSDNAQSCVSTKSQQILEEESLLSSLPPSLDLEVASIFRQHWHHRLVFTNLQTSMRVASYMIKFTAVNLEVCCNHASNNNNNDNNIISASNTKEPLNISHETDSLLQVEHTTNSLQEEYNCCVNVPYGLVCNTTSIHVKYGKVDFIFYDEEEEHNGVKQTRRESEYEQETIPASDACETHQITDYTLKETCATISDKVLCNWSEILIVGETGTGKSYQLRRLALFASTRCKRHVFDISVEELACLAGSSNNKADTSTALHEIFQRAMESTPSTVVIDDIHLICGADSSNSLSSSNDTAHNDNNKWTMKLLSEVIASNLHHIRARGLDVQVIASAPNINSLDATLTSSLGLGEHVITLRAPQTCEERCVCIAQCIRDVLPDSVANKLIQESELCEHILVEECEPQEHDGHPVDDKTIKIAKMNVNRTLDGKLSSSSLELSPCTLRDVADRTHGFTQRDLRQLIERTMFDSFNKRATIAFTLSELVHIAALTHPSSLRQFEITIPEVSWNDIGGSEDAKAVLQQVVQWSLGTEQALFTKFHLSPPKGVLLYGPPGCSKTMLAKALAHESHMNFISIKGPEVFSKWVGDSEKAVREIFTRARASSPCVVFIDELDGMCGHRGRGGVNDRVISQFLTELDGLPAAFDDRSHALVFVAATNRPDQIDAAVLRPGRIDRKLHIGLPEERERALIARIHFRRLPVAVELTESYVATRTEGYTGAEVVAVIKEAAFHAISHDMNAKWITCDDVDAALRKICPRIDKRTIEWYKQWPNVTTSSH